jgi:dTDP-4-dehydrorhamnose reductase
MRVLVAGARGQIGQAVIAGAPAGAEIRAVDRAELDLTQPGQVRRVVRDFRPDLVVNAAGYTAVDLAESHPDAAYAVNRDGASHLAVAAAQVGGRMLHFSTDYVFDGQQRRAYAPGDPPNPLNAYGKSKLAGERAVLDTLGDRAVVMRTAWVYATAGRNFLLTMLRLLGERNQVSVVTDQIGTPTSARSVARATWAIADRPELHGVLHWTDGGTASWYDFAVAIREDAIRMGLLTQGGSIVPIPSEAYPTPACRPRYSVLDCSAAHRVLQLTPDDWRLSLRRTLSELADG